MQIDDLTGIIIDTSIKIHRDLGPGLLESVYEMVLAKKIEQRGLSVLRQYPVDFEYDGIKFNDGFRLDLLVEKTVVVELKSVEKIAPATPRETLFLFPKFPGIPPFQKILIRQRETFFHGDLMFPSE